MRQEGLYPWEQEALKRFLNSLSVGESTKKGYNRVLVKFILQLDCPLNGISWNHVISYANKINYNKSLIRDFCYLNVFRIRVLKRDNFTCKQCGSKENVQVHHIIERQRGRIWGMAGIGTFDNGTDEESNLITLCKKCHDEKTQAQKDFILKVQQEAYSRWEKEQKEPIDTILLR
jgi:hypothetical protein